MASVWPLGSVILHQHGVKTSPNRRTDIPSTARLRCCATEKSSKNRFYLHILDFVGDFSTLLILLPPNN